MDRRCPTCNQFKDISLFRSTASGRPARDCLLCEAIRWKRPPSIEAPLPPRPSAPSGPSGWDGKVGVDVPKEFRGVDIDRIHYLRGAVRAKKVA